MASLPLQMSILPVMGWLVLASSIAATLIAIAVDRRWPSTCRII